MIKIFYIAHHIPLYTLQEAGDNAKLISLQNIHKKPMPKLGGVGIFLAFLFGYILFGEQSIRMNSILIGSFIIIIK